VTFPLSLHDALPILRGDRLDMNAPADSDVLPRLGLRGRKGDDTAYDAIERKLWPSDVDSSQFYSDLGNRMDKGGYSAVEYPAPRSEEHTSELQSREK